jgi:hypothetical protein
MRSTHFREILRESEVAYAIRPVIAKHALTFAQTRDALVELKVPHASEIATLVTLPVTVRPSLTRKHFPPP